MLFVNIISERDEDNAFVLNERPLIQGDLTSLDS